MLHFCHGPAGKSSPVAGQLIAVQQDPEQALSLHEAIELNLAQALTCQQSSHAAVKLFRKLEASGSSTQEALTVTSAC